MILPRQRVNTNKNKGDDFLKTKTISMCQGKGCLSHNNREFSAKNIDSSRTADNIVFIQQDLGETYHQLFDEAVERYNARQKRKDRRISDYFQHLFNRLANGNAPQSRPSLRSGKLTNEKSALSESSERTLTVSVYLLGICQLWNAP